MAVADNQILLKVEVNKKFTFCIPSVLRYSLFVGTAGVLRMDEYHFITPICSTPAIL